jgi:hypothetical protein
MPAGLRHGDVLYCHAMSCVPPKRKYFVVLSSNSTHCLVGFINTDINPFELTEQLLDLHLPLCQSDCPFLEYDSFLDCAHPGEEEIAYLQSQLSSDSDNVYKGTLKKKYLDKAIDLVKNARTLSRSFKVSYGLLPKRPRINK